MQLALSSGLNHNKTGSDRERRSATRKSPKSAVFASVRVFPTLEDVAIQIYDYSSAGLGVVSKVFIAPGTQVMLRIDAHQVFGRVRHIRRQRQDFFVGISVETVLDRKCNLVDFETLRIATSTNDKRLTRGA